jgi:D-lactate dehydrogenase
MHLSSHGIPFPSYFIPSTLMKIAFFSSKSFDRQYFDRFNTGSLHAITFFDAPLNADTATLAHGFEAVCIFVNDKIDKETIEQLSESGIKAIALRCTGYNNVDIETATQKNLKIFRVPAYSPQAVAEHAVALILALNRKTHKAFNRIRENNFSIEHLEGFNLYGKTTGVIGTGLIGSSFSAIMKGFGCKVIAYDIAPSDTLIRAGVEYTSLEELLKKSDIISLHCPLAPETQHLVNEKAFSKMKDGVMLINTSRGGLIDTQDAIDALKSGKLGYLGIDVYEQEAGLFFKDMSESIVRDEIIGRLLTFPNVLVTGHQGFFTKEALEQIAVTTLNNLSDFEKGAITLNEVKFKKEKSNN